LRSPLYHNSSLFFPHTSIYLFLLPPFLFSNLFPRDPPFDISSPGSLNQRRSASAGDNEFRQVSFLQFGFFLFCADPRPVAPKPSGGIPFLAPPSSDDPTGCKCLVSSPFPLKVFLNHSTPPPSFNVVGLLWVFPPTLSFVGFSPYYVWPTTCVGIVSFESPTFLRFFLVTACFPTTPLPFPRMGQLSTGRLNHNCSSPPWNGRTRKC